MKTITTQQELDNAGSDWVRIESGSFNAWGNSHVEARGNSHVEAWGNSHVVAREDSHVVARGNSHVVARGNSHVVARDFSSIVKLSFKTKIICGCKTALIIPEYPKNIKEWCAIKGIKIKQGRIRLFKCTNVDGTDFKTGTLNYLQKNKEITAPDWDEKFTGECGYGLHLADSPEGARYFVSAQEYLLLQVSANINDCRPFGGLPEYPMKLRARACRFIRIIEKHITES